MKAKNFIFQISKSDMEEIAAATNPTSGLMMRVEKRNDSVVFSVDEYAFKLAVWAFLKNGGLNQTTAQGIQGVSLVPNL